MSRISRTREGPALQNVAHAILPHLISPTGQKPSPAALQAATENAFAIATTALSALCRPTGMQLQFGAEADENGSAENAAAIWAAMIDAASEPE